MCIPRIEFSYAAQLIIELTHAIYKIYLFRRTLYLESNKRLVSGYYIKTDDQLETSYEIKKRFHK